MVVLLQFLGGKFLAVDAAPREEDVSNHKGDYERHDGHSAQRKLAGAAVRERQGALNVHRRGIVGGTVPCCQQEHSRHRCHSAYACRPYSANIAFAEEALPYAVEYKHNSCEEGYGNVPHVEQVVKILVGLNAHDACRIDSVSVLRENMEEESEEEEV